MQYVSTASLLCRAALDSLLQPQTKLGASTSLICSRTCCVVSLSSRYAALLPVLYSIERPSDQGPPSSRSSLPLFPPKSIWSEDCSASAGLRCSTKAIESMVCFLLLTNISSYLFIIISSYLFVVFCFQMSGQASHQNSEATHAASSAPEQRATTEERDLFTHFVKKQLPSYHAQTHAAHANPSMSSSTFQGPNCHDQRPYASNVPQVQAWPNQATHHRPQQGAYNPSRLQNLIRPTSDFSVGSVPVMSGDEQAAAQRIGPTLAPATH